MNEHSDFPKNFNRPFGGVTMPSMLDHAIDYAREHGWPVFPCDPKTKKPLTENGFKDASTDPEQISAWWHRHPDAMIGIPTGATSHIVVLDVDVDPDKGIDGRQSLNGLDIPPTMAVRTPRGGIHYYFDWPDGTEIRNSAGQIGPGLDVRGEGGYVIVPPSVNAAGKVYQWATGEGPVRVPDWFLERTKKEERPPQREWSSFDIDQKRMQSYGDKILSRICDECAFAPEGTRHEIFLANALKMFSKVKGGYSTVDRVSGYLRDAGLAAGRTAKEVDNDIRDAYAYATPSGLPEDRPYHLHSNGADSSQSPMEQEPPKEIEPFATIDASTWHGTERPVRTFLDERKLIPFGYATNLSGAGAVGKTLLALQASVACTAGTKWLNAPIKSGPVLFYSAEEPLAEMHIRIDEICEAENLHLSALKGLHIIDLNTVVDASLITGDNKLGRVKMTDLFERLRLTIERVMPVAVFLDNRGLLVTGNENDRTIASMAMRALQLLAEKYRCAVILLSHPSLTGLTSGTGSSGSTGWFNTGRSTIYMSKPEDSEDDDQRTLENNKANYAKHGTKVNLLWQFGRFICTDPPPQKGDAIGKIDKAERVFLKLLRWHAENNLEVSPSKFSPTYAPTVFEAHKEREGLNRKWFRMAMENLISFKKVEVKTRGRKDQPVRYLVEK